MHDATHCCRFFMVGSLCVNLSLLNITMICAKTVVPTELLFRLALTIGGGMGQWLGAPWRLRSKSL